MSSFRCPMLAAMDLARAGPIVSFAAFSAFLQVVSSHQLYPVRRSRPDLDRLVGARDMTDPDARRRHGKSQSNEIVNVSETIENGIMCAEGRTSQLKSMQEKWR